MADGESDTFKRVLIEGNPYFLALTFSVSLLHSLFDVLAFKNDIGFWRGKKNVEGLSVRTILLNCFCQVWNSMSARYLCKPVGLLELRNMLAIKNDISVLPGRMVDGALSVSMILLKCSCQVWSSGSARCTVFDKA